MVTKAGVKVLDFGLAEQRAQPRSRVGRCQHPHDADRSPRNGVRDAAVPGARTTGRQSDGRRTDIFACGAVIYEMVTGRRAFDGDSHASVVAAIMRHDPPSIATVQPAAPPGLVHVVSTCLAKDPDDRWQNAGNLTRELKWIAGLGSGNPIAPAAASRTQAPRVWMTMAALLLAHDPRARRLSIRAAVNGRADRGAGPRSCSRRDCGSTGAPHSAGSDDSRCRLTANAWRSWRPIPTATRCSGCGRSTRCPRCRSPVPTVRLLRSGRPIRA